LEELVGGRVKMADDQLVELRGAETGDPCEVGGALEGGGLPPHPRDRPFDGLLVRIDHAFTREGHGVNIAAFRAPIHRIPAPEFRRGHASRVSRYNRRSWRSNVK